MPEFLQMVKYIKKFVRRAGCRNHGISYSSILKPGCENDQGFRTDKGWEDRNPSQALIGMAKLCCLLPPALSPHLPVSVGRPTFLILLIGPAQGVLRGLLGGLAVLLPDRAGACVGAGHGGQAQAVSRGGGAHGADGRLPLVG